MSWSCHENAVVRRGRTKKDKTDACVRILKEAGGGRELR